MNLSKTIFFIIPLLLLGCTPEDDDSSVLEGTWQSEEFPSNGRLSDIIYNFSGNNFNELISNKDSDGEYTLTENTGSLEVLGETITTETGLTAYQINLTYDRDKNSLVKQIAYVSNNELFLGNTNIIEDDECLGDSYTTVTTEIEIVNGIVVGFEEVSTCYLRPTSINLSFPYAKKS